jgi:hypothetical protein
MHAVAVDIMRWIARVLLVPMLHRLVLLLLVLPLLLFLQLQLRPLLEE